MCGCWVGVTGFLGVLGFWGFQRFHGFQGFRVFEMSIGFRGLSLLGEDRISGAVTAR